MTHFNASVAISKVQFDKCALPGKEDCKGAKGRFQCGNGVSCFILRIFGWVFIVFVAKGLH